MADKGTNFFTQLTQVKQQMTFLLSSSNEAILIRGYTFYHFKQDVGVISLGGHAK